MIVQDTHKSAKTVRNHRYWRDREVVCSEKFKVLAPFDGIFNVVHIVIPVALSRAMGGGRVVKRTSLCRFFGKNPKHDKYLVHSVLFASSFQKEHFHTSAVTF